MRCRALVLAALGAGCVEVPGPAPPVCSDGDDDDGDGWGCDAFLRLPDCDDGDAAIHPGADEVPGDGIDQDCIGGDPAAADMLAGVVIQEVADNPEVQMPGGGHVRFPTTGARFPEELGVDLLGGDVLYQGPGPATEMGIAIDPLFHTVDVPDAPQLEIRTTGPAIGIARFTWNSDDVAGSAIEGESYLWFFPDGRIVRNDFVNVLETITGTDLDFSAYVSFRADPFTHFIRDGLVAGVPLDAGSDGEIWSSGPGNYGYVCLYDEVGGGMAGFGWYSQAFVGGGPRARTGAGGVTLSWDWVRDAAQIDASSYSLASVTFYAASGVSRDCDLYPTRLGFEDGNLLVPVGQTVYSEIEGAVEIVGPFLVSVQTAEPYAEVRALSNDDGVSLRVLLPADTERGVTVWVDDVRLAAGVDYLRQYGASDDGILELYLYLREVGANQVIRVAAPGGEP